MLQNIFTCKELVICNELETFSRNDRPKIRRRPKWNNKGGNSFIMKKIMNSHRNSANRRDNKAVFALQALNKKIYLHAAWIPVVGEKLRNFEIVEINKAFCCMQTPNAFKITEKTVVNLTVINVNQSANKFRFIHFIPGNPVNIQLNGSNTHIEDVYSNNM